MLGVGQKFQDNGFFARPVEEVSPDLVGCFLFTNFDGRRAGGMIIETEAYDQNDVFAHCFVSARDREKAAQMLAEPGNLYLYYNGKSKRSALSINISCDRKGFGSAVLIRAVEPLDESCAEVMKDYRLVPKGASKELRGDNFMKILANGPANVGDALGMTPVEHELSENGQLTVLQDPFELYHRSKSCSPLSTAREGLEKMYQKFLRDEPARANHPDAQAHMQKQWRWFHPAFARTILNA